MATFKIERIGFTDDFYADLAKQFPRNVSYIATTRTGTILDTYDYTFSISMVVYRNSRPITIWWDFNCEIDIDFDIEKFLSAYENFIR